MKLPAIELIVTSGCIKPGERPPSPTGLLIAPINTNEAGYAPEDSQGESQDAVEGQFTLSFHYISRGNPHNHLDLFLMLPGSVEAIQFRLPLYGDENKKRQNKRHTQNPATRRGASWLGYPGVPHRARYMSYSGALSKNRGRVRVLARGKFRTEIEALKSPNGPVHFIRVN